MKTEKRSPSSRAEVLRGAKIFEVTSDRLRVRGIGRAAYDESLKVTTLAVWFKDLDAEDIRELQKLAPAVFEWRREQAARK
jgi:hypothetical protein